MHPAVRLAAVWLVLAAGVRPPNLDAIAADPAVRAGLAKARAEDPSADVREAARDALERRAPR